MKKKCIAIAKKAMVWTLAASMLVATPLTASAAGLRGVYKVEDQYGNVKDDTNPTRTGTVTSTNTNTKTLDANVEAKIVDIVLSQTKVELETGYGVSENQKNEGVKLEATIITEDGSELDADVKAELLKNFTWKSKNTEIATIFNHKKDGTTNEMTIRPKKGGETTIEVSLDNHVKGIHFTKTVDVHVKEYATKLDFTGAPTEGYVKHTVDMAQFIVPTASSANDDITWSVDCASGAATITDKGVVTFKKYNKNKPENNVIVVNAVPERGDAAKATITISEGVPANAIQIQNTAGEKITKGDLDIGQTGKEELVVKAVMTPKEEGKNVTDLVTWSSNKSNIVSVSEVETENNEEVTLKAVNPGKAVITAKASSGKSAKVTVTVKATLTGLKVTTEDGSDSAWSGQKVQMAAKTTPKENNEGVKWSIVKVNNKPNPNASINAKGVLTIKNKVDENVKVLVKATSKKPTELTEVSEGVVETVGNKKYITATYEITVQQGDVSSIKVFESGVTSDKDVLMASFDVKAAAKDNVKNKKTDIYVPKDKKYYAEVAGTGGADSLTWTSSNSKVASVGFANGKTVITANKSGSATITVSGINVNKRNDDGSVRASKVIKASFKVNVIQPVTELTMNKTSVVLKNTGRKQTVSVTAKANKNNAKDTIEYSIAHKDGSALAEGAITQAKVTKGSFVFQAGRYSAGEEFVITAKAKKSGATAKAYVKVVSPSFAVVLNDSEGNAIGSKTALSGYGAANALTVVPQIDLKAKRTDTSIWADPNEPLDGGKVAAGVDYTVNKKGIVQIVKKADGSAQITRLKKGTVTVTVKTTDGKSAKVKLTDN